MNSSKDSKDTLVYSTDLGRVCADCGSSVKDCRCQAVSRQQVIGDGNIKIARSTKGRKGKGVSLITGVPLNNQELKDLAKRLKQAAGVGGTVKNGVIEIQSDNRELLKQELAKAGFNAKLAGS